MAIPAPFKPTDAVTCSTCGAPRPPELFTTSERPPCPQCGGAALTFTMLIEELFDCVVSARTELIPGNQARDWKQRWNQLQNDFQSLTSPSTETMSEESIHAWLQRLFSFFIHAYHLKDALKDAASSLGLKTSDIENAITNDPRLALLADLANLDKHSKLTNPPRSRCVPVIDEISGIDSTEGNGWFLSVKIRHGTATLDGLSVSKDTIAAWQEKLSAWGIL